MSSGYICDSCNGEHGPVVQLITSLANGRVAACCEADLPVSYIAGLASILDLDAGKLYEVVRKYADREAKREQAAAAKRASEDLGAPAGPDCQVYGVYDGVVVYCDHPAGHSLGHSHGSLRWDALGDDIEVSEESLLEVEGMEDS